MPLDNIFDKFENCSWHVSLMPVNRSVSDVLG